MSSVDAESTSSFGMISPPQGYVVSQGHPGRSAIWKYFQRIEDEKGEGTICMVPKATASGICGTRKSKCYSSSGEHYVNNENNNYCIVN